MPAIQLRVYHDPGSVEVFVNIKRQDEGYERVTCILDTGSPVLFLPKTYLTILDYRLSERGNIQARQAGVANQVFNVTEAYSRIYLEDLQGQFSQPLEVLTWFTETDKLLIGFGGLLERAILHLDMPNLNGYLDLP